MYFYFSLTCALSVVLSIYDVWLSVLCFQVFHLATICYILSRWFLVLFCIETTLNAPGFVEGIRVAHLLSCLCCPIMCFTFWVPCCDHRYDLRIVSMFGSSLPEIVVGGRMSYVISVCLGIAVSTHIVLCFSLFFFVLCTLCCQSLCIVIFDCPFGDL